MTAVQFKCPKCGATYEGTEQDIACDLRVDGMEYQIEWNCMKCTCGEPSMIPVATPEVLYHVSMRIDKEGQQNNLCDAQVEVGGNDWSKNRLNDPLDVKGVYWWIETDDGMKLEYWPALDQYRYTAIAKWTRGLPRKDGGIDFIRRLTPHLGRVVNRPSTPQYALPTMKKNTDVFDYSVVLGRPNPKELTPKQRTVNERTPPSQEELAAIFGYDANIGCLFYIESGTDRPRYVSNFDFKVLINGIAYPIWRVKSMLLLGNPNAVPPEYEKLKEFNPPNKPMAPIPPERIK